jgi:hypothetical protein
VGIDGQLDGLADGGQGNGRFQLKLQSGWRLVAGLHGDQLVAAAEGVLGETAVDQIHRSSVSLVS